MLNKFWKKFNTKNWNCKVRRCAANIFVCQKVGQSLEDIKAVIARGEQRSLESFRGEHSGRYDDISLKWQRLAKQRLAQRKRDEAQRNLGALKASREPVTQGHTSATPYFRKRHAENSSRLNPASGLATPDTHHLLPQPANAGHPLPPPGTASREQAPSPKKRGRGRPPKHKVADTPHGASYDRTPRKLSPPREKLPSEGPRKTPGMLRLWGRRRSGRTGRL